MRRTPAGFEKRYRHETRGLTGNLFLKNWKSRVVFTPSFRKAIMKSGLQSVRMVEP